MMDLVDVQVRWDNQQRIVLVYVGKGLKRSYGQGFIYM
jgi:hypothetical protein